MLTTQEPEVRQEYGTARGWRLFIYILIPPLILLFLVLPFLLWDKSSDLGSTIIFGLLGFGMALFFLYCLLETIKSRHIITADKLIYEGVLRRKELPLANIKGYRTDQNYTYLIPQTKADPQIRIGHTSENYAGMQQWFADNYADLDILEQQQDAARLLQEEELGRTVEEREAVLAQEGQKAKWLNIAGGVVAAWLFLQPQPYEWAIMAGLAVPLLATTVLWLNAGVIRPDERKNSASPSVALAILLPSIALLLRATLDFEILEYASLWPQAAVVAAMLGLALLVGSRPFISRNEGRGNLVISIVAYAVIYGFGAVITYNCTFDEGSSAGFDVPVLNKHKSTGKTTTYYLEVGPWGPRTAAEDVSVTADYYEQVVPGDTVQILLQPGRLHVPWFTVAE